MEKGKINIEKMVFEMALILMFLSPFCPFAFGQGSSGHFENDPPNTRDFHWFLSIKPAPLMAENLMIKKQFSGSLIDPEESKNLKASWDIKNAVALPLPENIYSFAKKDLSDLRIMDSKGTFIPFIISAPITRKMEKMLEYTVLNQGFTSDKIASWTLDFGKKTLKSRLDIESAGSGFQRIVTVEGKDSTDEDWLMLVDNGKIYSLDDKNKNIANPTVQMGLNDFRYIKVKVKAMDGEKNAPKIFRITPYYALDEKAPLMALEGAEIKVAHKRKQTLILVDLGQQSPPVHSISFVLDPTFQRSFSRAVSIRGRDTTRHIHRPRFESGELAPGKEIDTPWEYAGSGTLLKKPNGESQLTMEGGLNWRFLEFTVNDDDSGPLPINNVQVLLSQKYLIFEPSQEKELFVYGGSTNANDPRYESENQGGESGKRLSVYSSLATANTPHYDSKTMLEELWPLDLPQWEISGSVQELDKGAITVKKQEWLAVSALFVSIFASSALLYSTNRKIDSK